MDRKKIRSPARKAQDILAFKKNCAGLLSSLALPV
jgi:hypothetical protein